MSDTKREYTAEEKRAQVRRQGEVLSYLARKLAQVHDELNAYFVDDCSELILDTMGRNTHERMEILRDMLNAMDAVMPEDGRRTSRVFEAAQDMFPVDSQAALFLNLSNQERRTYMATAADLRDKAKGLTVIDGQEIPTPFTEHELTCFGVRFPRFRSETKEDWYAALWKLLERDEIRKLYEAYRYEFVTVAVAMEIEERGDAPDRWQRVTTRAAEVNSRQILTALFRAAGQTFVAAR